MDKPMSPSAITMELLGRGTHASPRCGCSILELASVLAGERWDSWAASVHPALAVVASTVNDLLSDDRRRLLVPFAPCLLGTNQPDSQIWPAITRVCLRAARSAVPGQIGRPSARQLRAALRPVAALPGRSSEQELCQVLVDCINVCRQFAGQAPVDPRRPLEDCPAQLDVEPYFTRSPGCDWLNVSYRVAASANLARF